jgi:hypothetical protein
MQDEPLSVVAHAWTTVCDRSMFDRDTDNLSLDTIEAIYVDKEDDGEPTLVPCHLEVVSLWYRRNPALGGRCRVHVCVLSPDLAPLTHVPIEIDLETAARYRTRCIIEGLLVHRPGTYFIAVDLLVSNPALEVARVPLQVEFTRGRVPVRAAPAAE